MELLETVTLLPQFLAKDTSKIPFSLVRRLQNPPVSRMCKQSHGNCREILTLSLVKPGPSCCLLLLLFEFGRQAPVRGLNVRLGGSGACGADLSFGISCSGNTSPCACAGGWPCLLTWALPQNRGSIESWARREEIRGRVAKGAGVPGTRHQETRTSTPLVSSLL